MAFVARAVITLFFALFSSLSLASTAQYAIIVDAGSTGSRLHLFEFTKEGTGLPVIQDIFSKDVKPGLSSYGNNPQDAGPALKTLFDQANDLLKSKQIDPKTVAVDVMGTAGMRLLAKESEQKAAAVYQQVTQYLQSNYSFQVSSVSTVPEKMEGVYGWLDINYLGNHFGAGTDNTVGAIDMGGSSTEITYSTRDTSRPDDEITITLNGFTYTVFSKNFLSLGQDQARNSMNANELAAACYPVNYEFAPNMKGSFNAPICGAIYVNLINEHQVAQKIIPIQASQKFIAFSGVYYAYHFLDIENTPTRAAVGNRIQQVCTSSWDQLKTNYPSVAEKYLSTYCANSMYIGKLLYATYQLQNGQLEVTSKVNGKDIDWTLGALLFKLSK